MIEVPALRDILHTEAADAATARPFWGREITY